MARRRVSLRRSRQHTRRSAIRVCTGVRSSLAWRQRERTSPSPRGVESVATADGLAEWDSTAAGGPPLPQMSMRFGVLVVEASDDNHEAPPPAEVGEEVRPARDALLHGEHPRALEAALATSSRV